MNTVAAITKTEMNKQIGYVRESRRHVAEVKKRLGARSASYRDARALLKRDEAKLLEMTIQFFGGE